MQDNTAPKIQSESIEPKAHSPALLKASDKDLTLATFFDAVIKNNWKGKSKFESEAAKLGITTKYRRLLDKLELYKVKGLEAIVRKEREDNGETRATSSTVLRDIIILFTEFQCAIRTYEEIHKRLRARSLEFTTFKFELNPETGKTEKTVDQVYKISSTKEDGKIKSVLYQSNETTAVFSTLFVAGEYTTTEGEALSIGSYQSIAGHLREVRDENQDMLHIQRFGTASLRLKKQHSIRRDYSRMHPNELLSADNKKLDLLVIDWGWNKVVRPWLSGFLRVATRQYSYEISASPNSESIANSFVLAAKKWGLPKTIGHDLGKDYLSDRLAKMWQGLNIKQEKSISRNARAKAIESFHNILDNKLKCLVGYTGNKYQEMPERTKLMLKKYTKAEKIFKNIEKQVFDEEFKVTLNGDLAGRLKHSKTRFFHISELPRIIDEALQEYEETIHGGLKRDELGKKVYDLHCKDEVINELGEEINKPIGRLNYHVKTGWQPVYARDEVLAVFAMNSAIRVVSNAGIAINDKVYYSAKLRRYLGKRVLVKYTGASDKFIYIFSSPEIENLKDDAAFRDAHGFEILNRAKFVSLCELVVEHFQGEKTFIPELMEQRRNEKELKQIAGITQITGFEANIIPIQNEIEEVYQKNTQYKKLKDQFDE